MPHISDILYDDLVVHLKSVGEVHESADEYILKCTTDCPGCLSLRLLERLQEEKIKGHGSDDRIDRAMLGLLHNIPR